MIDKEVYVKLRHDPEDCEPIANMWFGLAMTPGGGAALYLGADTGSRGVVQTLRLSLSNACDPLPDLAAFAERAYRGQVPFSIEIDSEGPVSHLSIRSTPGNDTAILEVREVWAPVVYFAAQVDSFQLGVALAHALRAAIEDPANVPHWIEWYMYYGRTTPIDHDYFGSDWLRKLVIKEHPSKDEYFDGIETWNGTYYPWIRKVR